VHEVGAELHPLDPKVDVLEEGPEASFKSVPGLELLSPYVNCRFWQEKTPEGGPSGAYR
jgi:hypothetical protein